MATTEADLDAYLHSKAMDEVAAYLDRGQQFSELSDGGLRERRTTAFRAWVHEPINDATCGPFNDLESEFALRGIKKPYDDVREDRARLQARVEATVAKLYRDPELLDQFEMGLVRDIEEFVAGRDRRNN